MLECYTKKTPMAKKKHTCSICGGPIEVGEKCVSYSWKTGDGWFRYKYHLVCQKIIDNFLDDTGEEEYSFGTINEWLYDLECHGCDKHNKDTYNWGCYNVGIPIRCPKIRKEFGETEEIKP